MEKPIYEEMRHGLTIKIYQDDNALDPRKEFDHMGTMICFHRDYNMGDEHNLTQDDLMTLVRRKDVLAVPLYLLDHSGLWLRTGRFAEDPGGWDTSFIGYIYVTWKTIQKEYGKVTVKTKEKALNYLEAEVKEYNDFLTGNVYGYVIEEKSGETLDSCWGFYGDYDGKEWGALKEAQSMVDSITHNGTTEAGGQEIMGFARR